jgi:hypothetical protein
MKPLVLSALLAGLFFTAPAAGTETDTGDKIILTIAGKVKDNMTVEFTRAQLEKLAPARITTKTPWHDGIQTFEGVSLATLMRVVGADGSKVQVIALNKYRTEIPIRDFEAHRPILAYRLGGKDMSIRDKGPLFIIYPFDDRPELRSEEFYGRSVWQVRSMTIE